MTSTEFALIGALLAAVAFLSVKEIGGAMSGSMMTMSENVGGGGSDPVPQTGSGDGGDGTGGDGTSAGGSGAGGDQSGSSDPTPTASPPAGKDKKKKKKKKKDKKKKK